VKKEARAAARGNAANARGTDGEAESEDEESTSTATSSGATIKRIGTNGQITNNGGSPLIPRKSRPTRKDGPSKN
jgi:hypothetical protein